MNPIGASILVALVVMILLAPRRWALIALMAGVLYLPEQQAVEVFGISLTGMSFLEVAGLARVIGRREFSGVRLNPVDHAVLWVYGYTTLVFLIRADGGHAQMLGWMVDCTFS